jgi:hypothetical protein
MCLWCANALVLECQFLNRLDHPNIIDIHGASTAGAKGLTRA